VYRKGKGLLNILIHLCIQRYMYIIQVAVLFVYAREYVGLRHDYDEIVYRNKSNYFIT
jgi:hypothetical protein